MEILFLPCQIEGAFIQGVGLYTIEELQYSPQGVLHTRGPNQYKIPAVCDIPTELHISFLPPSESSNTLYSSKVSCAWQTSSSLCEFVVPVQAARGGALISWWFGVWVV